MWLDSNLSWKFHVIELSKKLARTAGLLFNFRHYAPKDTLICYTMEYLHLSYFMVYLCGTYPTLIDSMFALQKKALKIITFKDPTSSSVPLFDSLCILQLNDTLKLQISSFVYECIHNLAPVYFSLTSIDSIHGIGTRQLSKRDLYAVRYNTILLFTNCKVHTGNIRTAVWMYVRTK